MHSSSLKISTVVMLVALAAAFAADGRAVSMEEATQVAAGVLRILPSVNSRGQSTHSKVLEILPLFHGESGDVVGYVAGLSPAGYVVLSADTELPAVIAYSLGSSFEGDANRPNLLRDILALDLANRLEALQEGQLQAASRTDSTRDWDALLRGVQSRASATSEPPIGPLIGTSSWSQTAPWSDDCPIDPVTSERSAAGCVAVAMGQILSFWRFPGSVEFVPSDSYRTTMRSIWVDAALADTGEISYGGTAWRNPDDATMAALTWAAGVSVRMDYSSAGSGAKLTDAAVALAGAASPYLTQVRSGVWHYESAEIRTCVNAAWGSPFYQSVAAFYEQLRTDLREGRPALLCVARSGSGSGHALVCDGYDPVLETYHLNLGWGGLSDAWYALPDDVPGGFNIVEYGILRIDPGSAAEDLAFDWTDDGDVGREPSPVSVLASPNPASGPVVFRCDAPKASASATVQVDVFSLTGELVWSSASQSRFEVAWDGLTTDGSRLERGVYLYVMTVTSESEVWRLRGKLFVVP